MKRLLICALVLSIASSALAITKPDLDARIRKLASKLDALQSKPDRRIPAENLAKAKGIVLLDRTKAGFIFAWQGGSGVAMVKDSKSGQWSAPVFLAANEGSLGFQIGGQHSFVVILLMNTNATRMLSEGNFDFGGEASGTAGNSSTGVEGKVSSQEVPVLIYSDTGGLYGGVSIKGGALTPDNNANLAYYGEYLSTNEILFDKKAKPTPAAEDLAKKMNQFAKAK